jgi:molecular chaperone HtpG
MTPIWKKNKSEVTEEELNQFYKSKFNDYENPLINIFTNVEGNLTYNALCYIPSHAPYDLYSDTYEKGLQLYTKGVFILDKCKELIPNYLRFVKGLVDSADLSLNISREMLQHDRQLIKIASNLEKKILNELSKTLKNDREKYEKFFEVFGLNIKYGLYEEFGARKDSLKDLVLFSSVNSDNLITLAEYVEKMKDDQEFIYYASGKTKESILSQPQMDAIKTKDYDVLVLTDDVDEFMITILAEYNGKKFKSINSGDLDLLTEDEKKAIDELKEEKKSLLEILKESLDGEVKEVVLSKRLTTSPVCLVSGDGVSFEMERVMNKLPNDYGVKADKILEINPHHEIFKAIETLYERGSEEISKYAKLLYSQALLIEGIALENPVEFANLMCELMVKKV